MEEEGDTVGVTIPSEAVECTWLAKEDVTGFTVADGISGADMFDGEVDWELVGCDGEKPGWAFGMLEALEDGTTGCEIDFGTVTLGKDVWVVGAIGEAELGMKLG